jgi:hypothetical protein
MRLIHRLAADGATPFADRAAEAGFVPAEEPVFDFRSRELSADDLPETVQDRAADLRARAQEALEAAGHDSPESLRAEIADALAEAGIDSRADLRAAIESGDLSRPTDAPGGLVGTSPMGGDVDAFA